jgi:glyoxylase-like metal-dependent hydrolase (beta-lactamase superfamily II)
MISESYQFKVGDFDCFAISDGIFIYSPPTFPPPAVFLFGNASKSQLEQSLLKHNIQRDHWSQWISPYICLLIDTGDHLVLVDTGAKGLDPNTGKLLKNLKALGISPEDIEIIIITHCHPDHISGITLEDGKIAFPNARYVMWKGEWDFWNSGEAEIKLSEHFRDILIGIAHNNLKPIQDRISLIEHEIEIVPGIKAISAPGHTPGHMALSITSQGQQLMNIADVVLHPIHLEHTEWCAATDLDPDQVVNTRRHILNKATVEKSLVLAFHFPFPGLGHIVEQGKEWEWLPI